MSALHVLDMDGTLLRGTTASLEIARAMDQVAELEALEGRLADGDVDPPGFSLAVHELWGELTAELVAEVAAAGPWIDGVAEVLADVRARGERSMLITLSPDFYAEHLRPLGFDEVHGSAVGPLPLAAPPDPAGILLPEAKVRLTDAELAAHGIPAERCVAYGDSFSDVPLFEHLERSVAVNASPAVEALAAVAYRGEDLREAYALARELLDG